MSALKEIRHMPQRFLLLEKIAFSLFVTLAVACSAFIAYEQDPDVKVALHEGEALIRASAKYSEIGRASCRERV